MATNLFGPKNLQAVAERTMQKFRAESEDEEDDSKNAVVDASYSPSLRRAHGVKLRKPVIPNGLLKNNTMKQYLELRFVALGPRMVVIPSPPQRSNACPC